MANGILIIEDEATLAKNIKRYLEHGDYEVCIAESGALGIEKFEAFRPDAVLLDYRLSDISGLEVLGKIREKDSNVKIILMTAYGSASLAEKAMRAGAYHYLRKPIALAELKLLLIDAIG